jgi:hypothetical protein
MAKSAADFGLVERNLSDHMVIGHSKKWLAPLVCTIYFAHAVLPCDRKARILRFSYGR